MCVCGGGGGGGGCVECIILIREWPLSMTGVGAEDFFQNKKTISNLKAKMCGRFQTPMLIMAINFIPQFRYPRANCDHINYTAHKEQTVGLPLKPTASSDYECTPRTALRQLLSNLRVEFASQSITWKNQGRIGTYNFVVPGLSEPLF